MPFEPGADLGMHVRRIPMGKLRIGTSPLPVMETRLIVRKEPSRAAGRSGELE